MPKSPRFPLLLLSLLALPWLFTSQAEASQAAHGALSVLQQAVTPTGETPQPFAWSTPFTLAEGTSAFLSPVLLADTNNWLHALWTQGDSMIYYRLFDGRSWSRPLAAVTSPEPVRGISAVIDRGGNLFLIWDTPGSGRLYFTRVLAHEASLGDAWDFPKALKLPYAARSPQAVVDQEGVIHIAFSVPFNEGRGIYWLKAAGLLTPGQAIEWSDPEQTFNAGQSGWSVVDQPRLVLLPGGNAYMTWIQSSLPPESAAQGLFASRSKSGVWSPPLEIARGSISWSQTLADANGALHLAWKEASGGRAVLLHQYSTDGGLQWSAAGQVSWTGSTQSAEAMLLDGAGRLHILQASPSGYLGEISASVLRDWLWDPSSSAGGDWISGEQAIWEGISSPAWLSAFSPSDGGLAALFSGQLEQGTPGTPDITSAPGLFFSRRQVDLPAGTPTPLPTFTPLPPQATPTASDQELTPAATLVFSTLPQAERLPGISNSRWGGLIVGAFLALLVVALALAWGARRLRNRGR